MSGVETVCEHCEKPIWHNGCTWYHVGGYMDCSPPRYYLATPRTPETQGVRIPDGWISVKDLKPAYGVPVWVVYHGVVQFMSYARDIGEWRAVDDYSDPMPESFVSHWMPIPEPPKETQ